MSRIHTRLANSGRALCVSHKGLFTWLLGMKLLERNGRYDDNVINGLLWTTSRGQAWTEKQKGTRGRTKGKVLKMRRWFVFVAILRFYPLFLSLRNTVEAREALRLMKLNIYSFNRDMGVLFFLFFFLEHDRNMYIYSVRNRKIII